MFHPKRLHSQKPPAPNLRAHGGRGAQRRGRLHSAAAAIVFATAAALLIHRQAELGIRTGLAETLAIIKNYIAGHKGG